MAATREAHKWRIKYAVIDHNASGDNTLVEAVTGKKIRVLSYAIVVAGAVTVKFQSGTSTDISGAASYAANGGIACNFNEGGWFETDAGEALNMVLGGAVGVAGHLSYVELR